MLQLCVYRSQSSYIIKILKLFKIINQTAEYKRISDISMALAELHIMQECLKAGKISEMLPASARTQDDVLTTRQLLSNIKKNKTVGKI